MKKGSLTLVLTLVVAGAYGYGPSGYWLTGSRNEVHPTIARYDGGFVAGYDTAGGYDSLLAVAGDVRTAASGGSEFAYSGSGGDFGGLYDLQGKWSGLRFDALRYDPLFNIRAYDGTTDGTYNYFVNSGFLGGVWRTGRDWSNPQLLFALGGVGDRMGITYDPWRNSLWTSGGPGKSMIEEWDMQGNLLSSFNVTSGTDFACLAMDYTDGTLWMSPAERPGTFLNFRRDGTLIGQFDSQFTATMNFTAGEFNLGVVPEPAALLTMAAGALAIRPRRSRPGR